MARRAGPGIHIHRLGLWIPVSRSARPGMTPTQPSPASGGRACFTNLFCPAIVRAQARMSKQVPMSTQRSIVIGGGSFAGLALALALRQGLGAEVAVIVA